MIRFRCRVNKQGLCTVRASVRGILSDTCVRPALAPRLRCRICLKRCPVVLRGPAKAIRHSPLERWAAFFHPAGKETLSAILTEFRVSCRMQTGESARQKIAKSAECCQWQLEPEATILQIFFPRHSTSFSLDHVGCNKNIAS